MTQDRWARLMQFFGCGESLGTFEALETAYAEKQRFYHTAAHVSDCLERFDESADLADHPAEVELTLWFHDAIYNPMRSGNEEKSADWARSFLIANTATDEVTERVGSHILATKHMATPDAGDASLVVDIDLSILGSDTERYDKFETQVRKEYRWVPMPLYRKKRREILESFLARPSIYSTAWFRDRYEEAARRNLVAAVEALR